MTTEHRSEHSWLDDLFWDEAAGLYAAGTPATAPAPEPQSPALAKFNPPVLPETPPAPEAQRKAYWKTLRAFFRGGKGGGLPRQAGRPSCYPALLAPYVAQPQTGSYPCWLDDEASAARPLRALIEEKIRTFAPGESEARILKDNLLRLELLLKKRSAGVSDTLAPRPFLDEALDELVLQLDLRGKDGEAFLADVNQLRKALPSTGKLIPLSPCSPLHLLAARLSAQARRQKAELKKIVDPLAARLRQLLAVEREKDPSAHSATTLESSMDFAGAFLNFDELSTLIPNSGSVAMPEERLHRLEQVLKTLEDAGTSLYGRDAWAVIDKRLAGRGGIDFQCIFPDTTNVEMTQDDLALERIADLFDQNMLVYARVFAAIRIAGLELDDRYQHDVHGDFFNHFSPADFSAAELALCPPFILVLHSTDLIHFGLNDFSALLASNRPVKCLALKFDALGHLAPPDKSGKSDPVFRQEPAALAVAHRDCFVLQTTIADPARLFDGFREGLESPTPAFFYVLSSKPKRALPGGALVWASAALGGREFPYFTFDSRKGPKWGSRFDIGQNPGPDSDWPEETLLYTDADGAVQRRPTTFTFADFAAADPDFERFFHLAPPEYASDDLVPLADYLRLPETETYGKVPFIWMVDAQNRLQKAAVAYTLVQTCLERLDFWHFLQENAGVHSYHVEQAEERLRREYEARLEQKIAELQAEHARALEQTRDESARNALERVADFLLDLDTEAPAPRPKPAAATGELPAAEPAQAAAPPPPAAQAAEPVALAEAWIETPLCTSCNECINLNGRMFKYNNDKQAYLADASAGTFAELVKAAENCPVAIIHPGAPLNPNEPGLNDLIKRAAKFN